MARYVKWVVLGFILLALLVPQSGYCKSIQTLWGLLDLHGFITQESAWSVDSTQDFHNITDYFTMQLESGFTPAGILGDYVSFYGIFRFRADWAYAINRGSGWWEAGGDRYRGSYSFHNREHVREFSWAHGTERDIDLPRELYADIYLGNWQFRIGKQQVVWGESDGIRLMDCINPRDMNYEFVFRDSDEGYESSRIPLWLIKAEYYIPGTLFDGLIKDQKLEFIINPGDIEHDRWTIGAGWRGVPAGRYDPVTGHFSGGQKYITTYGDMANDNGPWAFQFPWLPQFSQVWPQDMKQRGHMEFFLRYVANIHNWYITLNGGYGYQHFFILKWRGVTYRPGLPGNVRPDELQAIGLLPPAAQARLMADAMRGGTAYKCAWGGYRNPWMNPHIMQFNYSWYFGRKQWVGFTVNKDMWWFRWRNTSPVLRIEAQYEFSKKFPTNGKRGNRFIFDPVKGFQGLEWSGFAHYLNYLMGYSASPYQNYNWYVRRDVIRYMIGYDWPVWIHWLNPYKNFFTSFQFFHFRILNYGDDELVQCPLVFNSKVTDITLKQFLQNPNALNKYVDPWRIPRDRFYVTFLVNGKYDHEQIVPQILYVHDLTEDCFWIKAKIKFAYGDNWREEIGWLGIFTDPDADYHGTGKSFGVTAHNSQIYFKISRYFN